MTLRALAACLALGAGAMYFFDPERGRRRRARIRDLMSDTRERVTSLRLQAGSFPVEELSDAVLVGRVRGVLGRAVSNPQAIKVTAHQGHVILSGPVLAAELNRLLEAVREVRGVVRVDHWLNVYEQADNLPTRPGSRFLS